MSTVEGSSTEENLLNRAAVAQHTVEKIGGTSMSNFDAVKENIIKNPKNENIYQRIFVVSAYGGMTDLLLD